MKTIKLNSRLILEERETVIIYDSLDKVWRMDSTVMKHVNKAKKQGWTQTAEYVYEDGTVCGGVFEAPSRAVTIRSTKKKQMSEKQMSNLLDDEEEADED